MYCWGDAGGTSADKLPRLFEGNDRPYLVPSGQVATRLFSSYLGVHTIDIDGTVRASGSLSKCGSTQAAIDSFASVARGWKQRFPDEVYWDGSGSVRSTRLLARSATVPTMARVLDLDGQATCHVTEGASLACVNDCGDDFPGPRPLPARARVGRGYLLDQRTPTISALGSTVFGPLPKCFPAEAEQGECDTKAAFEVELSAHARELLTNEQVVATLDASGSCSLFLKGPGGELSPEPERFGSTITTIGMMDAPSTVCGVESDGSVVCRVPGSEDPRWEKTRTVPDAANIVQLSGGSTHMCGLRADGRVMCWGWNANGELGNGKASDPQTTQAHASLVVAPVADQSNGPQVAHRVAYAFEFTGTPKPESEGGDD